uniref:TEP1-F n=1 Tax=Glossina brevipalpis TaxID=37001 RepID=A0A1A9W1S9_9MUSC
MWPNLIYIFLHMLWGVNADGIYSIVAPSTMYSNCKYSVGVTLHDAERPAAFYIGITGPSYEESKRVDLSPRESKTIDFDVPELDRGTYRLTSRGFRGIYYQNSTKLLVKYTGPNFYIQTDKAIYKPGDLVQYRILIFDENLRPIKLERLLKIAIKDAANNLVKDIKNVQLIKGIFSGKLQLTEQPVLGLWKIEVGLDDRIEKTTKFEVAKYVLPKFSVDIDTVTDMAITESHLKMTIRAKYTYGKPVKGKATVHVSPVNLEITTDLNGKSHLQFNLRKQLDIIVQNGYSWQLKVFAVVEEELTGNRQNSTVNINLHRSPYIIEVSDVMEEYEINETFEVKAVVRYLNGKPVQDTKTPVFLNYYSYGLRKDDKSEIFETNLDENGVAVFKVNFQNTGSYSSEFKFRDEFKALPSIWITEGNNMNAEFVPRLTLQLKTIRPRLGEYVSIAVKAPNIMTYLIYAVVGRGNILELAYIPMPSAQRFYTITLEATFEMIPEANVFVYYVEKGDLKFEEIAVKFLPELENKIHIKGPLEAKPGEEISLEVKTDPNSYIGLLGVDQSVLLLKSGNDLDFDAILKDLQSHNTVVNYNWNNKYPNPGQKSGLVVMTNAHFPYEDFDTGYTPFANLYIGNQDTNVFNDLTFPSSNDDDFATEPVKIRQDFSEVWLFEHLENNDNATTATITKLIPDTITSWAITAFAVNEKTGLAMTENPFIINVSQPFFIEVNLPYSVKRGEVIAIPVIVFNYMDEVLDVVITMDNIDKEYHFIEVSNEIGQFILDATKKMKRKIISPNSGESASFMIRPTVVGDIELKIKAVSRFGSDAVHKKLKVEAEGITQYKNEALFLSMAFGQPQERLLEVAIPMEAVKDSEYLEFSVVGDLLGPTMKGLNELVRKPYGCGEQIMVNFVPNILVLRYLEAMAVDMPDVVNKAKGFLEIGYQRELTYKHKNGAFSVFGEGRSTPNTWLTAYVARSFIQAIKYTTIDEKVIKDAFEFLIANQEQNGRFKQTGFLFSPTYQNDIGFNAYVLLAFLESEKYAELYKHQIEKCLRYIVRELENENDSYALSLAAIALQKADHDMIGEVLEKLQAQAKEENGLKWWTGANDNNVEITAYALLALVDTEFIGELFPIIEWLINQRNSNGGFESTQGTVVGLEALIKFSKKFSVTGNCDMSIKFEAFDDGKKELTQHSFELNKDNFLVLQTHVLPKATRSLSLEADGTEGSSLVQLSYRYNLATKDDKSGFKLNINPQILPSQQLQLSVCANYQPAADDVVEESNMAVLEASLPSGYIADREKFNDIHAVERVQRVDTENSDTKVVVYFDGLVKGEQVCVSIMADKAFAVAERKPVPIILYDYYNTEYRRTEYYQIESSLCDICEGQKCGNACK